MGGGNWTNNANWLSERPLGSWFGVTTDAGGRVTGLELANNRLVGKIPAQLGDLNSLEILDLEGNQLSGPIPAELGALKRLRHLNLGRNAIGGAIPLRALTLPLLSELILFENRISGQIPAQIGNLNRLTYLNLTGNLLEGPLPDQLGSLPMLEFLAISGNRINGPIPATLGNLRSLRWLHLGHNRLVGQLPGQLGRLTGLEWVEAQDNRISGSIPSELGDLIGLRALLLRGNQLTGAIPLQLGALTRLERLELAGNQLTGCIPPGLINVPVNDLPATGLPACHKILPDLDVSPGVLTVVADGGASGRDYVLRIPDEVRLITIGPVRDLPVPRVFDFQGNQLPDIDPRRFGHQIAVADSQSRFLIGLDGVGGSLDSALRLDVQRGFAARFVVSENEFITAPGNERLRHNVPDLEVNFDGTLLKADFLTHFRDTGGVDRWGYPTSEVMILEPGTLTQFYQRGVVDFHDVGSGWLVERRLSWDYFGGGLGGSEDLGVEERVTNPNPGTLLGPWGHRVSNFAIDGTVVGFADFFEQFGGVEAFGLPKTDARRDSNTSGTLHVPAYTPGFIRQYFQSAVFEYHPSEPAAPIQLALLGDELRPILVSDWKAEPAFMAARPLRKGSEFLPSETASASQLNRYEGGFSFGQVGAGRFHNCAVTAAGAIICWGANVEISGGDRGLTYPPPGVFSAVTSGDWHTCAISAAGEVVCWGAQISAPEGQFHSIDAGSNHTCGVRADGAIECWGADDFNQSTPPPGAFRSVTAGTFHSCGIGEDAQIRCWGKNHQFQADPPAGEFNSVSAGWNHSCGITASSRIVCWGNNDFGKSDPPNGSFHTVSAGRNHSCGIDTANQLWCWGNDEYGQSSHPIGQFVSVSAGVTHTCAIDSERELTCWGAEDDAGSPGFGLISPPRQPYVLIESGFAHSCGLAMDGTVECWGSNQHYQTSSSASAMATIRAAPWHTCGILKSSAEAVCWGRAEYGQTLVPTDKYLAISPGGRHVCAINSNHQLRCWGDGAEDQSPPPADPFAAVSSGFDHTCGIRFDWSVECWGEDSQGQSSPPPGRFAAIDASGDSTCGLRFDRSVECWGAIRQALPENPAGRFDVISTGHSRFCGLQTRGEVDCWDISGMYLDGVNWPPVAQPLFHSLSSAPEYFCGVTAAGAANCWSRIEARSYFSGIEDFASPRYPTRASFDGPAPTRAPASQPPAVVVSDCFGGALQADPIHCAIFEGLHNEGKLEIAAIYRNGGALVFFLDQARPLSHSDYRLIGRRSYSERVAAGELSCRLGVHGWIECDNGQSFYVTDGAGLPPSDRIEAIQLRVGGIGQLTNERGWASFTEIWRAPEASQQRAAPVAGNLNSADVSARSFPGVDCSIRRVLIDANLYERYTGIGCHWWEQNPQVQHLNCRQHVLQQPSCELWLRHPDLGIAGYFPETPQGVFVQVKAGPGVGDDIERIRRSLIDSTIYSGVLTDENLHVAPTAYNFGELWRWRKILDRFAHSAGNSIGVFGAQLRPNWIELPYAVVYTPQGLGSGSRADGASLGETIVLWSLNLDATLEALPRLLAQLDIPAEAVGIVAAVGYDYGGQQEHLMPE